MDITEKERIDDQGNKTKGGLSTEQFCIVYAVCHVMGMLSACANPVIYGYLNENFNREFKEIFLSINECVKWPCGSVYFRRKQRSATSLHVEPQEHQNGRAVSAVTSASMATTATAVTAANGNSKVKVVALSGKNGVNGGRGVDEMELQPLSTIQEGEERSSSTAAASDKKAATAGEQDGLLKKA